MKNRIAHLFDPPRDPDDVPEPAPELLLPPGIDPRQLPPPEPNRSLPLEVFIGRDLLIGVLTANLESLNYNAPRVDAEVGNTPELLAETAAAGMKLRAMLAWVAQHPREHVFVALYPASEIEPIE